MSPPVRVSLRTRLKDASQHTARAMTMMEVCDLLREAHDRLAFVEDLLDELGDAAMTCREAQRAYFKGRSGEALLTAKARERDLDAFVATYERDFLGKPGPASQGGLPGI